MTYFHILIKTIIINSFSTHLFPGLNEAQARAQKGQEHNEISGNKSQLYIYGRQGTKTLHLILA